MLNGLCFFQALFELEALGESRVQAIISYDLEKTSEAIVSTPLAIYTLPLKQNWIQMCIDHLSYLCSRTPSIPIIHLIIIFWLL